MKTISCILLVCPLSLMGYVEETQEEQVERLIGELQDQNEDVRWNAVEALRQIGSLDAVPALIQALQDPDTSVRAYATGTLENIDTPDALKALREYQ